MLKTIEGKCLEQTNYNFNVVKALYESIESDVYVDEQVSTLEKIIKRFEDLDRKQDGSYFQKILISILHNECLIDSNSTLCTKYFDCVIDFLSLRKYSDFEEAFHLIEIVFELSDTVEMPEELLTIKDDVFQNLYMSIGSRVKEMHVNQSTKNHSKALRLARFILSLKDSNMQNSMKHYKSALRVIHDIYANENRYEDIQREYVDNKDMIIDCDLGDLYEHSIAKKDIRDLDKIKDDIENTVSRLCTVFIEIISFSLTLLDKDLKQLVKDKKRDNWYESWEKNMKVSQNSDSSPLYFSDFSEQISIYKWIKKELIRCLEAERVGDLSVVTKIESCLDDYLLLLRNETFHQRIRALANISDAKKWDYRLATDEDHFTNLKKVLHGLVMAPQTK